MRVLASLKTALAGEEAGLRKNSLRSPCAQGPPLKMDRAGGKRRVKKKNSLSMASISFLRMSTCLMVNGSKKSSKRYRFALSARILALLAGEDQAKKRRRFQKRQAIGAKRRIRSRGDGGRRT